MLKLERGRIKGGVGDAVTTEVEWRTLVAAHDVYDHARPLGRRIAAIAASARTRIDFNTRGGIKRDTIAVLSTRCASRAIRSGSIQRYSASSRLPSCSVV